MTSEGTTTGTAPGATLLAIRREEGVAGQYAYHCRIKYFPDEPASRVTFVGSAYGGSVVMISEVWGQMIVAEEVAYRCGALLSPEWIRRFYS